MNYTAEQIIKACLENAVEETPENMGESKQRHERQSEDTKNTGEVDMIDKLNLAVKMLDSILKELGT